MSVFDDNISNELSEIEKIRSWFMQRIIEYFKDKKLKEDFFHHRGGVSVTSVIYIDLKYMWNCVYYKYILALGVYNVCMKVSQEMMKNQFKVTISFCTSPYSTIDEYETIEVTDLKVDIVD